MVIVGVVELTRVKDGQKLPIYLRYFETNGELLRTNTKKLQNEKDIAVIPDRAIVRQHGIAGLVYGQR